MLTTVKKTLAAIKDPAAFIDMLQDATGIYGDDRVRSMSRAQNRDEIKKRSNFVGEAIQAFIGHADQINSPQLIQAFTTTGDIKQPASSSFDMFMDIANYDEAWMALFKDASNRIAPGTDFWEVVTGQQGSSWSVVPEGKRLVVRKFTVNDLQACKVHKWGDAIGITDEMIRFRKIGPIMDIMQDFRDGYGRAKANAAYAALTASAGDTTTPDTTGSTTLEKDINTINTAAQALLYGLKDTRNLPATAPLVLIVPDATALTRSRILRALGELSQSFATSTQRVNYNVTPLFTFNSNLPTAATGEAFRALMVVPGLKSQQATAMAAITLTDTDRLSLTYITSQFSYWGLYVLDGAQVRKVGFAS